MTYNLGKKYFTAKKEIEKKMEQNEAKIRRREVVNNER